jgi:hypothetical protein
MDEHETKAQTTDRLTSAHPHTATTPRPSQLRSPESRDRRPSDVLDPRRAHRTVELWRRAAVGLLAGTRALDTAEERTWVTHRGAGWYVMRDLARAIESVVLLDQRLQQFGLLSQHDRIPDIGTVDERRLVGSHVARVATWCATSSGPDEASTHARTHTTWPIPATRAPPRRAEPRQGAPDPTKPHHSRRASIRARRCPDRSRERARSHRRRSANTPPRCSEPHFDGRLT